MTWWQILLIILGAFILITLIRAIFFVPKKREYKEMPEEKIYEKRVADNLSGAIKFKTVSYPDPDMVDWDEFEKFHEFLEGAYPLIHKTCTKEKVSRASLLYIWKGKDSSLEPMALLAHQDVVPVTEGTESDWEHPAFSGHNDGEFIWGRGTLDMKNHLICVMEAVETLIEEGFVPERDVYICFGHDEEIVAAEDSGAKQIMTLLKQRGIRLDSVLDEGGALIPVNVNGVINKYLVGVGIAEKGYCDYKITINDKGGHSSQAPKHNALGKLANLIRDLENHQFKAKMLPFAVEMLDNVGRAVSYPARIVTCNLWLLRPVIKLIMKQIPFAACLIRTTTGVTMAQGSPAANVLPQKASVTVNFRTMPGMKVADVEKHIRKVVRYKDIDIELLKGKEATAEFSPTDSRAFKAIEEIIYNENPGEAVVAPYLVMGGTDSCFYEPICDNVYRFAPYKVSPSLLLCTHATNERCPVKVLPEGVRFFKRYIRMVSDK